MVKVSVMVNVVDLSDLSPFVLILNTHVLLMYLLSFIPYSVQFSSLGGFYNCFLLVVGFC